MATTRAEAGITAWSSSATRTVIARRVARVAARGAALWGFVFGAVVVASVTGYVNAYPTLADRRGVAESLGTNPGVQALLGTAHRIDTVAGFVAWRSVGVMGLVGGVWGLLTATRLLRGEEDAGRWELLLTGRTDRGRAALAGCAGLAGGLVALWIPTAVLTVLVGRGPDAGFSVTASLFLSVALVAPAAMFLAIGALCSQLAATRRQASTLAAAVLGVSFVVRLVADSGTGLRWLAWASPLGWVGELRPLTGTRPAPLLLVAAVVAGSVAGTVALARRRDLGGSILADRASAPARTRLLGSPLAFAVRLSRATTAGWMVGVALGGFIFGVVAKAAGDALNSGSAADLLARIGGRSTGARTYLGVAFFVIGSLVALQAAGHVATTRDEEADGRVDNFLVRPVRRIPWLAGRLAVAVAAITATGLIAALAAWIGAASQHTGVGLAAMVGAGLNVVPAGVVVLGIGTLAHAALPHRASAVAYGLVGWSFLIELVGGIVDADHWLLDLSLFHHLAPAPAVSPRAGAAVAMVLVGLAAAAVGAVWFRRRDLVPA